MVKYRLAARIEPIIMPEVYGVGWQNQPFMILNRLIIFELMIFDM